MLGGTLGIAALVCVALQLTVVASISSERDKVSQAQAERARLAETLKKIDAFRAEEKAIGRKLAIIEDLERSQVGPVRLMDEIAALMPERMWLTRMTMKGSLLKLEGMSLDNEIIAAFMTGLEESPLIKRVELKETRLSVVDGVKLNTFVIEAHQDLKGGRKRAAAPGADRRA